LQQIILEFALLEDVTGPMCSTVDSDKYVADGARRIRETIVLALQQAEITLTEEQLTTLCQGTASEAFIIRRLLEAKITGEMCNADIKGFPLYKTYRAYFNQTPEMVARALVLALEAAEAGEQQTRKN
jgi:hypothetical protein